MVLSKTLFPENCGKCEAIALEFGAIVPLGRVNSEAAGDNVASSPTAIPNP